MPRYAAFAKRGVVRHLGACGSHRNPIIAIIANLQCCMREYTTPNVSHGLILFINGASRSTNGRTGNFVDEIFARPAAAKALTLKDKLAWNSLWTKKPMSTCASISKSRAEEYAFALQTQRSNPLNLDERWIASLLSAPPNDTLEALGQATPSVTAPCDASATRRIYLTSTPLA